MNDLNVFMCIGRLVRDPELKYTPSGKATARFSLAVNKSYRNTSGENIETPLFININTWGKIAENVANYLHKGSKVAIQGSLGSNKWEDKEGNKRTSFEITAFIVQFLDGKKQVDDLPDSVINLVETVADRMSVAANIREDVKQIDIPF